MLHSPNKILDVYIEPDESSNTEGPVDHESHPIKLSIPDISHPEWAAGALKRMLGVKHVINVGSYTDEANMERHMIRVVYDAINVKDTEALANLIHVAIHYAPGIRGSRL